MTPELLADINLARELRGTAISPALRLTADGGAQGEIAYRLENRSARPIEVTAGMTSLAGDWQSQPDHDHRSLQPGESADLRFSLTRLPDDPESAEGDKPLSFPLLSTQVDYLGEQRRLSLPARRQIVAVRPVPNSEEIDETLANQVLSVDGKGSLVWIAPEVVRLPDGAMTLEAWFLANDVEGFRAIAGNTERSEFNIMLAQGEPQFLLHLDGTFSRARGGEEGRVTPGVWHHLAGVFDGQEQRLYLDGRLIDRIEVNGSRTMNDMPFLVGAEPNAEGGPNFPFDGLIDEVRVSTVPRYHGDSFTPTWRHEPDEDTALLLHLDGQEPPFVLDAAASDGHGILVGNATFVPIDPAKLDATAPGS